MAHRNTSVRHDRSRPTARRPDCAAPPEPRSRQPEPGGRQPEALGSPPPNRASTARRLSAASAVLILSGGDVHLCLYRHGYRFIPKIGVSFLLQFSSSAALAVALLVRRGRVRLGGTRWLWRS
jgi:hypothetical protein